MELKEQENSPEEAKNKKKNLCLTDTELKKEVMKILKGLRIAINRNGNYFRKEPENIRRRKEKLENSFAETKAELKTINNE